MAVGASDVVRPASVLKGAAAGAPAVVVAALVFAVVDGDDARPVAALLLTALLLGGLVLAGFVGGRDAGASPLTNGAVSAVALVSALQVLAVLAVVVRGRALPAVGAVLFRLALAYGTGLLGGQLAARRAPGAASRPAGEDAG